MLGSLSSGVSWMATRSREQYRGFKESWAVREEAMAVETERRRQATAVRMRQLRSEMAALQAEAEAEGVADGAEEGEEYTGPLTMFEQGALLGSLLLSPAGVPGVVVGGAFGGAAGYVTERIEQARSYISGEYNNRLETERINRQQMASTHDELKALSQVTVHSEDPDEAAALTRAFTSFLKEPANAKCVDCAERFSNHNDAWASLNLGTLMCVKCAAVHRSMGVNVSRVKSVVFDSWDATMVSARLSLL